MLSSTLLLVVSAFLAVQVAAMPISLFARHGAKATAAKNATAAATTIAATNTTAVTNTTATATNATAATSTTAVTQSAADFKQLAYDDFQISDGVGGTAEDEANAVFVNPFAGTDLSTVSSDVLDALDTMAKAAETAETKDFDPQIDAATGAAADALQVGKIKNKVLKLTGEVQVLNIKIAQAQAAGSSTSSLESSLATEQTKLTTDIATDKASAGQTSQGVTDASL